MLTLFKKQPGMDCIKIRIQALNLVSLNKINLLIQSISSKKSIFYSSISLPLKIKKFNIVKSPHVNKKARDQFEMRFYNRLYCIYIKDTQKDVLEELKGMFLEDLSVKISFNFKKCIS